MSTTFAKVTSDDQQLATRIKTVVRNRSNGSARSLQTAIGPSELGEKCVRRLAYKLTGTTKQNTTSDPWASISGTAIHAWLADAFTKDSTSEWLVEHRVRVDAGLAGTVDLFDVTNGIVIDHKCAGATSMKARKAEGPTDQQLAQINVYGYALELAGYTVNKVAFAYYPLGGNLDGLFVWIGDYDRALAEKSIDRLGDIENLVASLAPNDNPERWPLIPATPSRLCSYCPYFVPRSDNLTIGCPGES